MVKIDWKQAKIIRFCTHFAPLSYRYFHEPLIDIDIDISQRLPIDIDIFQNCLIDIDIFQNCLIDINIFKNDHIDVDIDINIFQKWRYIDNQYVISIFRTGLSATQWLCLVEFLRAAAWITGSRHCAQGMNRSCIEERRRSAQVFSVGGATPAREISCPRPLQLLGHSSITIVKVRQLWCWWSWWGG